jgi:ABC-2 type transport system ATP-binding protein
MPILETVSLGKRYQDFWALRECSLSVGAGQVFGLLGPNGAGKSTLLRLLLGFLRPTAGRASIAGCDCQNQRLAVHEQVSYLPGEARLFPTYRGREALRLLAELRGARGRFEVAKSLAGSLGLDLEKRVQQLSTGMRQQLALAAVLAADTPLVILDEPTANLDPAARRSVERLIREAASEGRTVILSSHVLSEVEDVCDRVAILRAGRLIHEQSLEDLRQRYEIVASLGSRLPELPVELRGQATVVESSLRTARLEVTGNLAPVLRWLAPLPVVDLQVERVGLRAIYERAHEQAAA